MSLVLLMQTTRDCLDIETMCCQELEHQAKKEQERLDTISIELMCVQEEIAQVKKELEELLKD